MIKENIERVRATLPAGVTLCAVTKLHSPEEMNEAIACGITDIGENKVQEVLAKYEAVNPGVRWHLIGHLQTNKVRQIVDKVYMIQSVDSLHLAQAIEKECAKRDIGMRVLLEVNPSGDENKYGLAPEAVEAALSEILETCPHILVCGLMCVAPEAENPEDVRKYFTKMKALYERLANTEHPRCRFTCLSMGMSGDYRVAVEEGSNMVRVGTAIFGKRDYSKEK